MKRKYIKEELIEQGSFGKVYLAYRSDDPEKRPYAIKILNKKSIDGKLPEVIKREIEIHKKFKHPNIISLIEVVDTGFEVGLVLEYIQNGDLQNYLLANQSLSIVLMESFLRGIVSGLNYLHVDQKIMHLDLKTENILLKGDRLKGYIVQIADFGYASPINDRIDGLFGTPDTRPPETWIEIKQNIDQNISREKMRINRTIAIDLYGLGVIIWQIVYKKNPYTCLSGIRDLSILSNWILQHPLHKEAFQTKTHISSQWIKIMQSCLSVNPDQRTSTIAIIAAVVPLCIPSLKNRSGAHNNPSINLEDPLIHQPQVMSIPLKNRSGFWPFWKNKNHVGPVSQNNTRHDINQTQSRPEENDTKPRDRISCCKVS